MKKMRLVQFRRIRPLAKKKINKAAPKSRKAAPKGKQVASKKLAAKSVKRPVAVKAVPKKSLASQSDVKLPRWFRRPLAQRSISRPRPGGCNERRCAR